jgi:two-component system, NarL family, response regulator NreC
MTPKASNESISILIVDDHPMLREGLRFLLEREPDFVVVAEAGNGREAVLLSREVRPDIVLMDVQMPELNGIDATKQIVDELPDTRVLALSTYNSPEIVERMLEAGALGYVTKNSVRSQLLRAIRSLSQGKQFLEGLPLSVRNLTKRPQVLSTREREVLQLLAEGQTRTKIAETLGISIITVETYKHHIFKKLKAETIADLVRYAIQEGLISV